MMQRSQIPTIPGCLAEGAHRKHLKTPRIMLSGWATKWTTYMFGPAPHLRIAANATRLLLHLLLVLRLLCRCLSASAPGDYAGLLLYHLDHGLRRLTIDPSRHSARSLHQGRHCNKSGVPCEGEGGAPPHDGAQPGNLSHGNQPPTSGRGDGASWLNGSGCLRQANMRTPWAHAEIMNKHPMRRLHQRARCARQDIPHEPNRAPYPPP